ncbi:MAG: hypothetical protein RL708_2319 [Bacteroidota bacterium]|jgi:Zn-dependent metalloprotease
MKKVFTSLFVLFYSFFVLHAMAQNLGNLDEIKNEDGMYDMSIRPDLNFTIQDLFTTHKNLFELNQDDTMKQSFYETSEALTGTKRHYRFKQFYKGYEVENADFAIQADDHDNVEHFMGSVVPNLNLDVSDPITENAALNIAISNSTATLFAWMDSTYMNSLKESREDSLATYLPKGKLLIGRIRDGGFTESSYRFVWSFTIFSIEPYMHETFYIDAITGQLVDKFDNSNYRHCNTGTVQTLYNGSRNFQTQTCTFCKNWQLQDCRGGSGKTGIETYLRGNNLKDNDNNWSATNEQPATSAHWALGESWDYFSSTFGRNGINNQNKYIFVNAGQTGYNNAAYSHDQSSGDDKIDVGQSTNGRWWSTLDVLGHEFTHGITNYTSNLIYEKESGALNESFSDIFATAIELRTLGYFNWTIGEDVKTGRDFSNPHIYNQPDVYGGQYWVNTTGCVPASSNDNCGVHTNSGVQNKWFNLLVSGGTSSIGRSVTGIGFYDAIKIVYDNLTLQLPSSSGATSTYSNARAGSISAAVKLFGNCSPQAIAVQDAWYAVGVGSPAPAPVLTPNYSTATTWLCVDGVMANYLPITLTVNSNIAGSQFTWNGVPSSWSKTINGNSLTITNFNNIATQATITVSASNCLKSSNIIQKQIKWYTCNTANRIASHSSSNSNQSEPEALEITDGISIYPNPATNVIYIDIANEDFKMDFTIYNSLGQQVEKGTLKNLNNSIDVSRFAKGSYFINFIGADFRKTAKFIVED